MKLYSNRLPLLPPITTYKSPTTVFSETTQLTHAFTIQVVTSRVMAQRAALCDASD